MSETVSPRRIRVVFALFACATVLLTLRVGYWQTLGRGDLLERATDQVRSDLVVAAQRGVIRDRTGALLATTVPLRPGMRFRGQVETEHLRGVVQVPADAVFVTPGGPVAYRKAGGDLERVRLGLGRRTPTRIEVVSGLAPGDRVSRSDPGAP